MSLACPNCGSSPDPRDLFCVTCGHPVRVQAAQTVGSTATSANGRAQSPGRGTSRISQAAPAYEADQPAYPQRPVRDHRQASPDVPTSTRQSGEARSSWPFTQWSAPMEYSQRNAGFPGRNSAFPGLPDGGTQRQSSAQPAAAQGNGSGQFSSSGVMPDSRGLRRESGAASRGSGLASTLGNLKDILTSVYGIIVVAASILATFGVGAVVGHVTASSPAPAIKPVTAAPTATGAGDASASPQPSSEPSTAGIAYLTAITPIVNNTGGSGLMTGPVQIGTTTYERSVQFSCYSGLSDVVYNVAGFKFLNATVGVPNNAAGAAGNAATIVFLKNGSTTQLGPPISDTLGQQQQVHLNLQGAEQLEIQCSTSSGEMNVALGNATFGPS
jgi:hypothetical protein